MLFAVATGTVYIKTSLSLLFSFSIYECLFISRLHNNGCLFWSQWHWMGIVLFSEVKTLINVVFFVVFFTCNQPLNYGETHQLQGCKAFFFFFFLALYTISCCCGCCCCYRPLAQCIYFPLLHIPITVEKSTGTENVRRLFDT